MRSSQTTATIMRDVLIALIPALVVAVRAFGWSALLLVLVCLLASVAFEHLYCRAVGQKSTIKDLSAAVTGVLLAFNLPPGLPVWMAVVGCFVAIVIVKMLFGGLGRNFANPAIVGRIVLMASFAGSMTTWWPAGRITRGVDAITAPTPLQEYAMAAAGETLVTLPSYMDLFLGRVGGSLGEISALALIIGGVYLVVRRVITITEPLAFIGTVLVFSFVLGGDGVFHILAGGVMLGAVFMGTDYVTTPTNESGKLIFGIGAGVITVLIRFYGAFPEGVSFGILIMNLVTPHIDNLTALKPFGGDRP